MSLRSALQRVSALDPTSIQKAASEMMKMYDKGADAAVTEWRNALQSSRHKLALLYVANEVLQISKRNRGNHFLEAFSPILGQALAYVCTQEPTNVEKVRRTVKIWGDRAVYSVRFIGSLLAGLEKYRGGEPVQARPPSPVDQVRFSPAIESQDTTHAEGSPSATSHKDNDEDLMAIVEETERSKRRDDDDDIFGDNPDGDRLSIDIDIENVEVQDVKTGSPRPKRRRGSKISEPARARRKVQLSTGNLLETLQQIESLNTKYQHALLALGRIDKTIDKQPAEELENLVGDELQSAYKQVTNFQNQIMSQRRTIHDVAQQRHEGERTLLRYLPWLERGLQQDEDDVNFCDILEQKIVSFQKIQSQVREARDRIVAEEKRKREEEHAAARRLKDEAEAQKFREEALRKETEAKPGMVWNPVAREYQMLDTNESWRDH